MKRKLSAIALLAVLAAVSLGGAKAAPSGAPAQSSGSLAAVFTGPMAPAGSGFTYQGRLLDGGSPANGQYDFRFTLFDAATGGNQVGNPITGSNQTVTNGLFTLTLDFGATVFRGDARFMRIEVQHNGGGYVPRSPRQPLMPTPYAMSLMPGNETLLGLGRCRRAFKKSDIIPRIARKEVESSEKLGRHRWVVERTLAWLN